MRAGDEGSIGIDEWKQQVSNNLRRLVNLLQPKADPGKKRRGNESELRPSSKPRIDGEYCGISG
eukprot:11778295-Alexandrium_andersonii.AAC.1